MIQAVELVCCDAGLESVSAVRTLLVGVVATTLRPEVLSIEAATEEVKTGLEDTVELE